MEHPLVGKTSKPSELTYKEAVTHQQERLWKELGEITVNQAIGFWLETLAGFTRRNYAISLRRLAELGLFRPDSSLQEFSLHNHEVVVDRIKLIHDWSEATRQARAACYISFTGFLQRRTKGLITKAQTNKEGSHKTFFKVREKVKTNALNSDETKDFLKAMDQLNQRDALIAKLILQGGKRKGEVLSLEIQDIDFRNKQIRYRQSKTKGLIKETIISYPNHIMKELRDYIEDRKGLCFITRNGRPIAPFQIDRNFKKAGELAGIPFVVTPHVLRVTLVTRLKEMKIQDSDIMKITGHASPTQLASYDKSDLADNASKEYNFV